ncbi:MAG: ABC transporter permease [Lachnospiraceae bacterium]|nr:ABC transporter permease [Lachnospiraceae bacterium]MDD4524746.1 ABC transporter permease [Lachnospiraceae bacterium]
MNSFADLGSSKLESSLNDELKKHVSAYDKYKDFPEDELFTPAEFDSSEAEMGGYSNYSYWKATLRAFLHNKTAAFFLAVIVIVLAFTFIQPLLPNQRSAKTIYNDSETGIQIVNRQPDSEFWFGTNSIGQDLWARTWAGTRTSLGIGFAVACWEALFGTVIGLLWGYVRKLDTFFTEFYNIFDNVPQTLVLILISYIMKPGVNTIIFALCLTGWLGMARFIRNQVVIIRDRDYNLASRCLGTSTGRIITKNLLPYLVSVITLRMALAIPEAIGNEVFVTYIGIGLPTDMASLGNLVQAGRLVMSQPELRYQLLFPTAVLAVITISLYIVGNSFADAADPKNHVD